MNQLSAADTDQLIHFVGLLLFTVGLFALTLGFFAGWVLRHRYDFDQWLKRGIYCDDCAPLVDRSPFVDRPDDGGFL